MNESQDEAGGARTTRRLDRAHGFMRQITTIQVQRDEFEKATRQMIAERKHQMIREKAESERAKMRAKGHRDPTERPWADDGGAESAPKDNDDASRASSKRSPDNENQFVSVSGRPLQQRHRHHFVPKVPSQRRQKKQNTDATASDGGADGVEPASTAKTMQSASSPQRDRKVHGRPDIQRYRPRPGAAAARLEASTTEPDTKHTAVSSATKKSATNVSDASDASSIAPRGSDTNSIERQPRESKDSSGVAPAADSVKDRDVSRRDGGKQGTERSRRSRQGRSGDSRPKNNSAVHESDTRKAAVTQASSPQAPPQASPSVAVHALDDDKAAVSQSETSTKQRRAQRVFYRGPKQRSDKDARRPASSSAE